MATIKTISGQPRYVIEGGQIKTFQSPLVLYLMRDTNCGLSFCEWNMKRIFSYEDEVVRDYFGGVLYRFDGSRFQTPSYRTMYWLDRGWVENDQFWKLYQIDGYLSKGEVALLITAFEKGYLERP